MTGKLRRVGFLLELAREACISSRLECQPDNPMRCRFASLSCKGKINHLIRLPKRKSDKLRKKIDSVDFQPIITKSEALFTDAPALLGENGEQVKVALTEFKHFLFLVWWNKHQGHRFPVVPTKRADVLWHGFLIFNHQYNKFCHEVYGQILYHKPGLEEGTSDFDLACLHTRMLHEEVGKYGYDVDYFSHVDTSGGQSALKGRKRRPAKGSSCSSGFTGGDGGDGGGCGGD